MLKQLEDCDWDEAFKYAGCNTEDDWGDHPKLPRPALPGMDVSVAPFCREDVAEIAGIREGQNDEEDWLVYGRLNDGRWFFLSAWCDYTGWG